MNAQLVLQIIKNLNRTMLSQLMLYLNIHNSRYQCNCMEIAQQIERHRFKVQKIFEQ